MNYFEKAKAMIRLFKLSNLKKFSTVSIPEIPIEWETFMDSKDEWTKIILPESENSIGCYYKGVEGSIFPPHKHLFNEQLMIMNPEGKIEIITQDESKILTFPNSYLFKEGEVHSVRFIKDTTIVVIWSPVKGDGWNADFGE